jgi:putative NIF3 family GTP cyclohydrolase 1 type 2
VPQRLAQFAESVAAALPTTASGVRVAGDPQRLLETVAVCGGAGDSHLDDVRASGVDVYVTADLRHHPASEFVEHGGPALVDCAHWATEWPWLAVAERALRDGLRERLDAEVDSVETRVSEIVTDPWTTYARSQH